MIVDIKPYPKNIPPGPTKLLNQSQIHHGPPYLFIVFFIILCMKTTSFCFGFLLSFHNVSNSHTAHNTQIVQNILFFDKEEAYSPFWKCGPLRPLRSLTTLDSNGLNFYMSCLNKEILTSMDSPLRMATNTIKCTSGNGILPSTIMRWKMNEN